MVKADLGKSPVVPPFVREFRPEPFSLTKSEWAADNRELVRRNSSRGSAGSTTLFTVPNNKTLYITNSYVSLVIISSGAAFIIGAINVEGGSTGADNGNIISAISSNISTSTGVRLGQNISISHQMPVKVRGNEVVFLTLDTAGASVLGGFVGYLE